MYIQLLDSEIVTLRNAREVKLALKFYRGLRDCAQPDNRGDVIHTSIRLLENHLEQNRIRSGRGG